jgi:hypothetical protein
LFHNIRSANLRQPASQLMSTFQLSAANKRHLVFISITSSARARMLAGVLILNAFIVLRSSTKSNFVGRSELHTDERPLWSHGQRVCRPQDCRHGWSRGGENVNPKGRRLTQLGIFWRVQTRYPRPHTFRGEQHLQRYVTEFKFRLYQSFPLRQYRWGTHSNCSWYRGQAPNVPAD